MLRFKIIPFFLLLAFSLFGQKSIPEPTEYLVNDYAGLMSQQEVDQLGNKLTAYAQETSTQIVIVTERSLEGASLFDYTIELAEKWKIGQGQEDNGILIYVSEQDRKIQIQTGYGSEGFLPDIMAKRIIENIIKPAFRQNRYFEGLDQATTSIMQRGEGEYTNNQTKGKAEGGIPAFMVILFLLIMIIVLSSITNRHDDDDDDDGGYYRGGRYDMDDHKRRRRRRGGGWIFLPGAGGFNRSGGGGGGSDGGGFGGFGGGGFGGFGGGGFGGGGAFGEW